MKRIFLYSISAIFTMVGILMIYMSNEKKDVLMGVLVLLSFGVGGICINVFEKKGNKRAKQKDVTTITEQHSKIIALMLSCLAFMVLGYFVLPFNHLFDNTRFYTPVMGWIVGVISILFFGYGFVVSIKRLIKPRIIIQISDDGFFVSTGDNKRSQFLIDWKDIDVIGKTDLAFLIYLKNPDLYPTNKLLSSFNIEESDINIALSIINHYDIEVLESIIRNKIMEHSK
jgi:hypothetical protein